VTVTDWFLNDSRQIEHIQADGATLEADAVRGLVDALANYASPPADSAPGVSLVNLIGSYWDVEAVGTIEWT
jgi:hypothetical protein